MSNAERDHKLAGATVALLHNAPINRILWLTDMTWLSQHELVDRLAAMPKPALCAAFIESGTLAVACTLKTDGSGGSPLADLSSGELDVEFGAVNAPLVLTAAEYHAWLSQYGFVLLDLAFTEVNRDSGKRLRALTLKRDAPDALSTIAEWPVDRG